MAVTFNAPVPVEPGPLGPTDTVTLSFSRDLAEDVIDEIIVEFNGDLLVYSKINGAGDRFSVVETTIVNVTTVAITPDGPAGWLDTPLTLRITVHSENTDAQTSDVTCNIDSETRTYNTVTDPNALPIVQNFVPPGPTPPTQAGSVAADVFDANTSELGAGQIFALAVFPDRTETIFVTPAFVAPYTGTVVTVGDTTTITMFRGGGWGDDAFTVTVIAYDQVIPPPAGRTGSVSYDAAPGVGGWPPDMQPFTNGAQP